MRSTTIGLIAAAALTAAACGGDDETAADTIAPTTAAPTTTAAPEPATTVPQATIAPTTVPDTTPPSTTVQESTTIPPTTVVDESWREDVEEICASGDGIALVTMPPPAPDPASLSAYVQAHVDFFESSGDITSVNLPPGPGRTPADLAEYRAGQRQALDDAASAAAAGDYAATTTAIDVFRNHLAVIASAFAASGQTCATANADVAANAALNVSMVGGWQLETGFGDVWVSQNTGVDRVTRIDPDTGEALAKIPMSSPPIKLQPADGRMVVRTFESYIAVDAETNAVVDTLLMAEVGPQAGRSWAVDGALWLCDGERLHRYDPATFEPVATVEIGIPCGQVHATADLAIAWTYNEDPGESGVSRAVFVDSHTNTVLGAVELAADAGVPVVLDDVVFFPPSFGSKATIVDRTTWTVMATPDYGRSINSGSQPAFDGSAIYVIADKAAASIVKIDPATFEITGEIGALATGFSQPNSLAASPGVLWAANNGSGVLQRFDTAG
jgi:hypothetical protein